MNLDLGKLAQAEQARQSAINTFVMNTSQHIYAQLLCRQQDVTPDVLRACAQNAKLAAPYLAEAYGLIKIEETPIEGVDGANIQT